MTTAATSTPSQVPSEPDLSFGLKWSFGIHLALIAFVLIKSFVFPSKPIPYIPTLKVDLVGLPDVLKKDLKHSKQSQINQEIEKVLNQAEKDANRIKSQPKKPALETTKSDEMVVKPKVAPDKGKTGDKTIEKRNKRALDRLKALSHIEEVSEDHPIKGNKISPGSSLSGEAKEAATANYYDLIRDRLQEKWTLPPWIARQSLTAQVEIFIDSQGKLRKMHLSKPSGNAQFDDAVKRAVHESQPFPPPPKEIASSLVADGISLGFPL
jgi:colicin import membrane protein